MHFHLHHPVALAGFAAPARHVEAEAPRAVATFARHGHFGHEVANGGEQAGVSGGVAAGGAANGALVHVDHFVKVLNAFNGLHGRWLVVGAVKLLRYGFVQGVVDQRGLARARNARHTRQQPHRNVHTHVLQVVAPRAHNLQQLRAGLAPLRRHRNLQSACQIPAG